MQFFDFCGLVSVKSSHTTTLLDLPELDEFADALIGQLAVELNEEKGKVVKVWAAIDQ